MVDMDWIEMRVIDGNLIPVAFIEVITYRDEWLHKAHESKPLTTAKRKLCEYSEKYWVPTYVVWTNPDLLVAEPKIAHFLVKRMGKDPVLMSAEKFKAFLRILGKLFEDYEPRARSHRALEG